MKIVVIHGQQHKGSTYTITKLLFKKLDSKTDKVLEFFTNDIKPCVGCTLCIIKDEQQCPERRVIEPIIIAIECADIVIAESPTYCMGMSGQLKIFFDHMSYRWMSHRPHPSMKNKIGVAISTAAGVGAGTVTKSIKRQLFWWGIAKVYRISETISAMSWDEVDIDKKKKIEKRITRIAKKINASIGKVKPGIRSKVCFTIMKSMHKKMQWNPVDTRYWQDHGWI